MVHAVHPSNHLFPSPKDLKLSSLAVVHGKDHDEIHPFVGLNRRRHEGKVPKRKSPTQFTANGRTCFLLERSLFQVCCKMSFQRNDGLFFQNLTRSVDSSTHFLVHSAR